MRYETDITDTKIQTPAEDDISGADVCYEYGDCLKETLTWDKVCKQLNKPRFRDTGLRKTRFSLIGESLSKNRRNKR